MAGKNYKDMKKYKLIKEYPGSPELGNIVKEVFFGSPVGYYVGKIISIGKMTFNRAIVENNPEFWEEAVEKDYEILATRLKKSGFIISKGDFDKPDYCGNNETIHSVKRLSDGEVFTIDKYVENTQYPQKNRGKINKFILDGDTVRVYYSFGWDRLKHISNCKQPVFTTVDGVNIFEGDRIYWQNPATGNIIDCSIDSKEELFGVEDRNFFSTKEAAEEYILFKQSLLSLNDVFKVYPKYKKREKDLTKHAEELIELAKEKLK